MNIRNYKKSDLNTILGWYSDRNQHGPLPDMFLEDSTFVLEYDNKPVMCISIYLTNSKEIALLEHLARDPEFNDRSTTGEAINMITNYVENFTKNMGYKRIFTLINRQSLKNKYSDFGYLETNNGISIFMKELV
jgi:hypothetical protein